MKKSRFREDVGISPLYSPTIKAILEVQVRRGDGWMWEMKKNPVAPVVCVVVAGVARVAYRAFCWMSLFRAPIVWEFWNFFPPFCCSRCVALVVW